MGLNKLNNINETNLLEYFQAKSYFADLMQYTLDSSLSNYSELLFIRLLDKNPKSISLYREYCE